MKIEVGKYYKTYGGWKAIVIWEMDKDDGLKLKLNWEGKPKYCVIHNPEEENESGVINYTAGGKAITVFSVGEPPLCGEHHPADLKEEWKE